MGIRPDFNKSYANPLREDDHASCGFYINGDNRIKFDDKGGGYNWDCFAVVEYLYKVSFKEAMVIIARDFGITGGTPIPSKPLQQQRAKERIELRIKQRDWNAEDKSYWFDKYYQRRIDLEPAGIFPISHAWYLRNGRVLQQFYAYKHGDPAYAYCFGGFDYKLYFPFWEKGNRFRQNRGDIIQGENLLPKKGHILIITKSFKDVMCIRKFSHLFDIHAVAPMSETQLISAEKIAEWKERFDYVFTLFDFDKAGIRLMRRYEKAYGITGLFFGSSFKKGTFIKGLGGIKDFADHLELKRLEETRQLLELAYNTYIG